MAVSHLTADQEARLRDLERRQQRQRHCIVWRWSVLWSVNATGLLICLSLGAFDPQGWVISGVWGINLVCASVWAWRELRSLPRQEAIDREVCLSALRGEAQRRARRAEEGRVRAASQATETARSAR
jgi:hypothetical protein